MCGIFAYVGSDPQAAKKAVRGLKDLEYRGYDSWGVVAKATQGLVSRKGVGKISAINEDDFDDIQGSISVGHTRWATHGAVCIKNTHPHFNTEETLAVVHNGIIENYRELREKLGTHLFRSETDTEVIPHLIDSFMRRGMPFESAFVRACRMLKGRFAFVAVHKDFPFILSARRGSPLIVGKGEGEYYLASDIPAFLDYTSLVYFIHDGEYVKADSEGVSFFNFETGKKIKKKEEKISWSKLDASKGGWDHFMLKEIMEQKESLLRVLDGNDADIAAGARLLKKTDTPVLTACGTAGHACMVAEYAFSDIAGINIQFAHASEFHKYTKFLNARSVVIPVTQSGETADVLEAIKDAKEKKAKILAVINARGSSTERESNVFLPINAGPEKAVASTKAATSQMLMFLLLAYAAAGKEKQGRTILRKAVGNIISWITEKRVNDIRRIAEQFISARDLFVIGKSSLYPIALEVALKIKEVSYIHAEGLPAGELKHGTIALIEKGTPCVALIGKNEYTSDILNSVEELKARGASIIGISPERSDSFDYWIQIPDAGAAAPIAHLIPGQILAYYLATLRGLDPDKPRNLAKSVTVK